MSKVKNPSTLEGVIHQAFHLVASKHKMDVDKVADIITDYLDFTDKNLIQKPVMKVRSKSRFYNKIIQVNVPVRFYWVDGEYDGLELGPFKNGLTRYQDKLVYDILEALNLYGGRAESAEATLIPPVIEKEFKERL